VSVVTTLITEQGVIRSNHLQSNAALERAMLTCVLSQCFCHTYGTVTFNLDPLQIRSPGMNFSEIYGPPQKHWSPPRLARACQGGIKDALAYLVYMYCLLDGGNGGERQQKKEKEKRYVNIPFGMLTNPELMKEKERAVRKLAVKRRRKLLCRYKSREGC